MIELSVRLAHPGSPASTASSNNKSVTVGSQSFDSQLSEAISEALKEMGIDPSAVQVSVNGLPSQSNAVSQNSAVVPVTTPAPAYPAPGSGSSQTVAKTATAPLSPDDAYWASQPAAVQKLRTIGDETKRAAMAMQLASEGYTIDYPIMVEGWDPLIAMQIRQEAGYTWVPSALQQPVPVAPGLTFVGLPTYNPNQPPPGSIPVQTSWT